MTGRTGAINGRYVLGGMLAFFAIVIAVNSTFIVLAVRSFPGEDVRRSYLQGLNYNDTLAQRRAQSALGWTATATLVEEDGGAAVEVTLRDHAYRAIDGASVGGQLRWPTDQRLDHDLVFVPRGAGRYVAAIPGLSPGHWVLRGRAEQSEDRALDFEAELTWPSSR